MRTSIGNQKGFTLIESMMAAAILSVTLLAVVSIKSTYKKMESDVLVRMMAHNIIGSFLTQLQAQNPLYPSVASTSGASAAYVMCYGKDSRPIANANGELGAQIVTTPLTHSDPTDLCINNPTHAGGFEVHLVRDANNPNLGTVHLIRFSSASAQGKESIVYKISVFLPSAN